MESNSYSSAMAKQTGSRASFEQFREPQTLETSGSGNGQEDVSTNSNKKQRSVKKGRPAGSRNRPKEIPVVYKESDDAVLAHAIRVEPGADIVHSLQRVYQSLQVEGLYLMSGRGTVADVSISCADSNEYFPGIFQILSLSGSCLPHVQIPSINLVAAYHETVITGTVQGTLRAVGPVDIVVGSCRKATLFRISGAGSSDNPSLVGRRLSSSSGEERQ